MAIYTVLLVTFSIIRNLEDNLIDPCDEIKLVLNEDTTLKIYTVSVDYLLGKADLLIDQGILEQLTTIQKLPEQEKIGQALCYYRHKLRCAKLAPA